MYVYLYINTFRMQLFHTSSRAQQSLWWIFRYTYICQCLFLYTYKCIDVCVSICKHLPYAVVSHFEPRAKVAPKRNVYMYIHTHIWYTCTCVRIYICTPVYRKTYICMYIYTCAPSVCSCFTLRAARRSRFGESSDIHIYANVYFYIHINV